MNNTGWPVRFIPIVIVLIILVALPLFIGDYYTRILTEFLIMALFGTSYALLLGYGGLLSLGHGALFAIGAYTLALFSVNLGLPLWFAFICGPILSSLFSLVIASLAVRLGPVYFAMLTLAFGEIIRLLLTKWYNVTNGDNGIVGLARFEAFSTTIGYYFFTFIIVVICFIVLRMIIKSPFTRILEGTRDNSLRMQFIGVNVRRHQIVTFAISGFFTGIAGTLYALLHGGVFPVYAALMTTVGPLFMCLIGGMYTFFGGPVGALVLVLLQRIIVEQIEYWPAIMGIVFILTMLIFPEGIMGLIQDKLMKNGGKTGVIAE